MSASILSSTIDVFQNEAAIAPKSKRVGMLEGKVKWPDQVRQWGVVQVDNQEANGLFRVAMDLPYQVSTSLFLVTSTDKLPSCRMEAR